jgi:hypothetical protein
MGIAVNEWYYVGIRRTIAPAPRTPPSISHPIQTLPCMFPDPYS